MNHSITLSFSQLAEQLQNELTENILPFWETKMVDENNGGFLGRIDGESKPHHTADKGVILNTRILWTFSRAYAFTGKENYKIMADRAYQYIHTKFIDHQAGGVFWMLDYKGTPTDTKKQIYAQAFAIYAYAEYYKITKNEEVLQSAIALFDLVEKHSFDTLENGYLEAFNEKWGTLDDLRLSEKDTNAAKTMNTHLHILEAYTNLYEVWPEKSLKKQLTNLVLLFKDKFINENHHFLLFFNEAWQLQSEEISFGHDIEGSWLLMEAAEAINEPDLIASIKDVCLKMVDASLEGMDSDGGLMNEANPDGLTDTDKHWWPQAEALVGLFNAWELTNDQQYLDHITSIWSFIQTYLKDAANGEWHWKVSKNHLNDFAEDKAGPWKCPYHNSRALIELLSRISKQKLL